MLTGYKRTCNPDIPRAPREPKIKPIQVGPRPKPSDGIIIFIVLSCEPTELTETLENQIKPDLMST